MIRSWSLFLLCLHVLTLRRGGRSFMLSPRTASSRGIRRGAVLARKELPSSSSAPPLRASSASPSGGNNSADADINKQDDKDNDDDDASGRGRKWEDWQREDRRNDGMKEREQRGDVFCQVMRDFPYATPRQARDAWMEHHWKRGGGLPVIILLSNSAASSQERQARGSKNNNDDDDVVEDERMILPILMKERLLSPRGGGGDDDNDGEITIRYTVSDPGFLFGRHVVPDSHAGTVRFEEKHPLAGGCRMTWTVRFAATKFHPLYEKLAEFTVGAAAATLQQALAPPRRFVLRTAIREGDPNSACRSWLSFYQRGGGLFLPPPIRVGEKVTGVPDAREVAVRIPPYLKEVVQSVVWAAEDKNADGPEYAKVLYKVGNPGWATFPFLLHTHAGRVCFRPDDNDGGTTVMEWAVEIRSYPFARRVTELLTTMVISTMARNFRVHAEEPYSRVKLALPRGFGNVGLDAVPKDTWLGGVLDAHLSDRRPVSEQTLSMLQPWTWGRTGTGNPKDDGDVVSYEWDDGTMEDEQM